MSDHIRQYIQQRIRVMPSGCWQWVRAIGDGGYGRATMDGRCWYAHRLSYEAFVGPIPKGLVIDHLCRNRACCNPDHLEPVQIQINNLRGEAPTMVARRTGVCSGGHALKGANLYIAPDGKWQCNECRRVRNRANGKLRVTCPDCGTNLAKSSLFNHRTVCKSSRCTKEC